MKSLTTLLMTLSLTTMAACSNAQGSQESSQLFDAENDTESVAFSIINCQATSPENEIVSIDFLVSFEQMLEAAFVLDTDYDVPASALIKRAVPEGSTQPSTFLTSGVFRFDFQTPEGEAYTIKDREGETILQITPETDGAVERTLDDQHYLCALTADVMGEENQDETELESGEVVN